MAEMLVVDDERFAVEGICRCRDWQSFGIRAIHTANHAGEARRVLLEHRIDILICDIEMPDEDGLSLVRWVKENSPHTESLFLTCHSEFAYAKQAIHLGSFDYLLKPVDGEELARTVARMLQAVREKEENARYNEMYRKIKSLWSKQQPHLAEHFWQGLLSRRILTFGDFLERALQDAQIGLSSEGKVMPVLVSLEEWRKSLEPRDQEVMEYAVKKAAGEILLGESPGDVIVDKNGVMFVLVYGSGKDLDPDLWVEEGKRFIRSCEQYFFCQVSCYVGRFAYLQELPRLCESLKSLERHNVTRTQSVIRYVPKAFSPGIRKIPERINVSEWSNYMLNEEREKLLELIHRSVEQWETAGIGEGLIEACCHDTLQVVYSFLHTKGFCSNQVPNFSMWASAQIRTLYQFKHWAENLVSSVMEAVFAKRETEGVVQRSIQFMKDNVEEDISREDVAAFVSLNPAYLSRLFKRETGQNLIDYLIDTKMNRAKELLDGTKMNVSAIAQQVGYSNFSHFTKMFRKQFGVNPQEYRKSQND